MGLTDPRTLRRLAGEATPGPWVHTRSFIYAAAEAALNEAALKANSGGHFIGSTLGERPVRYANGALIVAAVNALPGLLDERDRLREALQAVGEWMDRNEEQTIDFDGMTLAYVVPEDFPVEQVRAALQESPDDR